MQLRARRWRGRGPGALSLCLPLLLAAAAGCPGRRPGGGVAAIGSRAAPGAASAREAFEVLRRASQEGDARATFAIVTPETRRELLAGALLGASFATLGPDLAPAPARERELRELLARHRVAVAPAASAPRAAAEAEERPAAGDAGPAEEPAAEPAEAAAPPPRGAAALEPRLAGVADRAALFAELIEFAAGAGHALLTRYEGLHDVRVQGGRATGRATGIAPGGQPVEEAVELRRIDGRWFVHLPAVEAAPAAPGK